MPDCLSSVNNMVNRTLIATCKRDDYANKTLIFEQIHDLHRAVDRPTKHSSNIPSQFTTSQMRIHVLILILILYSPITIQEFFLQNESHRFLN